MALRFDAPNKTAAWCIKTHPTRLLFNPVVAPFSPQANPVRVASGDRLWRDMGRVACSVLQRFNVAASYHATTYSLEESLISSSPLLGERG